MGHTVPTFRHKVEKQALVFADTGDLHRRGAAHAGGFGEEVGVAGLSHELLGLVSSALSNAQIRWSTVDKEGAYDREHMPMVRELPVGRICFSSRPSKTGLYLSPVCLTVCHPQYR